MRRILVLLLATLLIFSGCAQSEPPVHTVRIAVPYTRFVRQYTTNYYKNWLEEQTGLALEFVEIAQEDAETYLRTAFESGNSTLDAVFLPQNGEEWISAKALQEFGQQGLLLPLEGYIDAEGANTRALFESFTDYDLRRAVTAPDGHIYALPGVRMTQQPKSAQTLWINLGWLKRLGLEVPRTTEELEAVLAAFATQDPNKNGLADELPIVGSEGDAALRTTGFLMSSFVYNDPFNAHMMVQNGKVAYAPATTNWRQGLGWLAGLYKKGLLPPLNFSFTPQQMTQLANDPRDLVGCFAAGSVTDVLLQKSPEVISRFIHMAPLTSPAGKGLAAVQLPQYRPGGAISSGSSAPEQVFRLMDLMMSREASLIAWYGEEGADWQVAERSQISVYGGAATMQVINALGSQMQNKTLAGLGPCALAAEDADGVTWNGFEVHQEYMDARAQSTYKSHHPAEYVSAILFPPQQEEELTEIRRAVEAYTDEMMVKFITAEIDLEDDAEWQVYLERLAALELPRLVSAVQQGMEA